MSHSLIIGMTESGKTTLAKLIVKNAKKKKIKTAVLDPLKDPHFGADFNTANQEEFLAWIKKNKSAVLVIDEAGTSVGRYNTAMEWVVTTSRHLGHSSILICQGAAQLSPLVRGQCTVCYLFSSTLATLKTISEDFNAPELLKIGRLTRGEFYLVSRYESVRKMRLDYSKGTIVEIKTKTDTKRKLDFSDRSLDRDDNESIVET